jgi:hypothetical protein
MAESIVGVDFDYTYNGVLSTDVLFKPSVETPAISEFFTIYPGQKYKRQIPLLLPLEKIVKAYTSCARTFTDGINITNTTLELQQLEVNMEWCKDDFEGAVGNVLSEDWLRTGIQEFDPSGTQIQRIIDQLVSDALRRDNFRIFSFGDIADLDANYNQLDGLWTKLIADATGGSNYCVNRVVNFGSTLGDGEAIAALQAAYTQSAIILKQLPNAQKYFAVTGSVYENLMASYERNVNGTERQFTLLTDGQNNLTYRGIRVIPVYAWDAALQDPANPLFGTVSHLMLYTTKANHAVGVDVEADANRIEGWYERKDRKYYIEGFQRLGYNYIHCQLQTVGY